MSITIDKSTAERLRRCARRERRPISQVVEFAIEALLEERAPAVVRAKILSIASLPALQVLPLSGDVLVIAFELCDKCGITRQRYFDAQRVATMIVHAIRTLITENDGDLRHMSELQAVNPYGSKR